MLPSSVGAIILWLLDIFGIQIANGTICIKFNYTFTELTAEEIDYTQKGLKFKNNETVILG